ncbi:MAG TPA: ATP-binding protein [Bryobacteraceae bacterium]
MISLRVRLVLLIVVLVVLVAVALSALQLDSLVNSLSTLAIERSERASQQVSSFLIDDINQHSEEYETPIDVEQTKALWYEIVSSDKSIAASLEKTVGLSPLEIVELNVANQTRQILASSNQKRVGTELARLQDFAQWNKKPLIDRVVDLMVLRPNFEVVVPLGIQGQSEQIVLIQVVTSGAILRGEALPPMKTLSEVTGGALAAAILLTLAASNLVLRPLKRIELTIDRIVQGNYGGEEARAGAREFAAVQNKLNLLGQQYRGARDSASELRHNVDELLERLASQLDVADRLANISRLTGGVAHEIKNPLNAIALRLDLLRTRLSTPQEELSDEDIAQELEIVSKEVLRLDRVVKTFLDFSKPMEVHFAEVDVTALLREVADLMKPPARLAGIELKLALPVHEVDIRADADMLKQAILNLVTNAMEAMKDGGELGLKAVEEGGQVTLEVSDSGPGIPPSMRSKVFQLYFTTKTRGSGMGLAMTYRAIQLHNGTVTFNSEEGRGTTFRLQLPSLVRHG